MDIPSSILGQLGLKVQHALRAFTANDRKAIKMVTENYPETKFYEVGELITALGIGEALVTALSERGIPTPLVHTCLAAPHSRMDVLTADELESFTASSPLARKYNAVVDRESAYELLQAKLEKAARPEPVLRTAKDKKVNKEGSEGSIIGDALDSTVGRHITRTIVREVTRGLMGVLGLGGSSRRGKRSLF